MRSSSAMTIEASSMSWCSIASSVRSRAWHAISMPASVWSSSVWSSSRYAARETAIASAEAPAHVVLGLRVLRVREDLLGLADLDQPSGLTRALDVDERGEVAGPAG